MKCNPEDILLYVEGELAPEDAARVRAHTAECASCREILLTEQALGCALGELRAPEPPAGYANATVLRAKCDVTQTIKCPHERRRAVLISTSMGALAILLLWPIGVLPSLLQTLAPLRCLTRFAIGWVSNAVWSVALVSRTLFRDLFQETHLTTTGGALMLVGLVALLVWLVVGYRRRIFADGFEKPR